MSDPTPAEIQAGAAAITRLGIAIGPHMRQVIAAAVLRAVLPDHDAEVRADERRRVAEEIARDIEQAQGYRCPACGGKPAGARHADGKAYRRCGCGHEWQVRQSALVDPAVVARQHATREEPT